MHHVWSSFHSHMLFPDSCVLNHSSVGVGIERARSVLERVNRTPPAGMQIVCSSVQLLAGLEFVAQFNSRLDTAKMNCQFIRKDEMWLPLWLDFKKENKNCHVRKNIIENGEPKRYIWERRRRNISLNFIPTFMLTETLYFIYGCKGIWH